MGGGADVRGSGGTGGVAVVTGAARGIGRGVAERLLRDGWRVVAADVDRAGLERTTRALAGSGEVLACPADVAEEAEVAAMVAKTLERFGRLNGLVNNAGVAHAENDPIERLDLARWNRVLAVNLTGAMLCAKHAAPALRRSPGGGAVVNVASTRARMSEPHTEAYTASKGGLVALTHALAISLGPAVRVNVVSPGWIDTDDGEELRDQDHAQHPAGRVGTPADVAAAVAYLLSPEQAGFMTGAELVLDGGMTRKMIYVA